MSDDFQSDDDYLMLSGLQHWVFCKRQCGLIHLDQVWAENRLTLEGQDLHQVADEGRRESRGTLRIERSVPLRSRRLRLTGRADVVEFHKNPQTGQWEPFPVEYKRGRPKKGLEDQIQLCAQAMCLEEQMECVIESGALYYGAQRRRLEVPFTAALRQATQEASDAFHVMMSRQILPPSEYGPKCAQCSLQELCMPQLSSLSLDDYLERPGEQTV